MRSLFLSFDELRFCVVLFCHLPSLHLFLIRMCAKLRIYPTSGYARYPSPLRSSSSRHLTECSFRMVCSLWAFSCFSPVKLWYTSGLPGDLSSGEATSCSRLFNRQDKALMCVNCNTFPVDAAICLICGTTVCLQSNCCIDEDYNNRGECNMHT